MSTVAAPSSAPLSDWVVSVLRTAVPSVWGALIAWVLTVVPLPHVVGVFLTSKSGVVAALAIVGWYALWRRIEPHLPAWATRLVLGSSRAPSYATITAAVTPVLTNVVDKAITDAATQVPALAPVVPLVAPEVAKITTTLTGASDPTAVPVVAPPVPAPTTPTA
ncbi:MAG TPA: hypothetical protein VMV41_07825 [Cellulomonadaceae bacterium]|nr:hypothetical protein [Cellulomonadaceae bacterium]